MNYYETCFIAKQELSEAQAHDIGKDIETIITDRGGKVHKTEYWGLRTLAYRIKKNRKGHYILMEYESNGDTPIEIERVMRINEDVLRFMTIRIEELTEEPSPLMERREQREAA